MDKRYQVFISSTYKDLQEVRHEATVALLTQDCIPVGMELFPAADTDGWQVIEQFIAACDYYIVIIAGRYGSIDPRTGTSYTEREYDFAVTHKIPALAFLQKLPDGLSSSDAKLTAFRQKIEADRHVKYWEHPKELPGLIMQGIAMLKKQRPRTGWVRGDQATDESAAQEIVRLRREIDELKASSSAPPEGAAALASGEETTLIHFTRTNEAGVESVRFSWDELFIAIGSELLTGRKDMEARLNRTIRLRTSLDDAFSTTEDFNTVLLQFRSLGLIERPDSVWQLTRYGDAYLGQISAIPTERPRERS